MTPDIICEPCADGYRAFVWSGGAMVYTIRAVNEQAAHAAELPAVPEWKPSKRQPARYTKPEFQR